MAFDTFDTDSVATAGVTFTNGNLTAQGASGATLNASSIAQTVEGKKSGKWYVEFTCVAVSGNVDGVGVTSSWGIGPSSGGVGGFLGGTNGNLPSGDNGWNYFTNGNIATKNIVQTAVNHPTWTTGDVIGLAIDLDNARIWWRKNTGSYAGTSGTPNPATNTAGFDISHLLSNNCRVFPAVNLSGPSAKFTANFGASAFTGSVPSGFNSGWTNTQGTTVFGSFCNPGLGATALGNFPSSSNKAVSKYTSSFTGLVAKITVAYAATTLTDLKGVIYDATGVGGLPGALLGVSTNTITSGAYGESDFNFTGISLSASTAYWFGTVSDSSGNQLLYVAASSALIATNSGTYVSPTNPFGASPTTANQRAPILVTLNPVVVQVMLGKGLMAVRAKGQLAASVGLRGKAAEQMRGRLGAFHSSLPMKGKNLLQMRGKLGFNASSGLLGRTLASVRGKGRVVSVSPLAGRTKLQTTGRAKIINLFFLKGKSKMQTTGKAVPVKFLILMYGRGMSQMKGRLFSQPILSRVITYTSFFWRRNL